MCLEYLHCSWLPDKLEFQNQPQIFHLVHPEWPALTFFLPHRGARVYPSNSLVRTAVRLRGLKGINAITVTFSPLGETTPSCCEATEHIPDTP